LFADHAQSFSDTARACHDRITVHGGVIEVRQRQRRKVIFRGKTIQRVLERNSAARPHLNFFEDFLSGFFFGDHHDLFQLAVGDSQGRAFSDTMTKS